MSSITAVASGSKMSLNLRRYPYWLAGAVFIALFSINVCLQPRFIEWGSIQSNLTTYLPLIILTTGQTYVVLGGGVDLSIGAIVSLVNVVGVRSIEYLGGSPTAILEGIGLSLAVGLGAGFLNGIAVGFLRLQPNCCHVRNEHRF